jgi:hypothetical protein
MLEHLGEGSRKDWLEKNRDSVGFKYKAYDWGLNSANLGLAD